MPKLFIFILIILISAISITSCNKGDEPQPGQIDSLKSVLPPQIITIATNDNADYNDSLAISIKYDTANNSIELYEGNPTNSNPYNKLALKYLYNDDGYLIAVNQYDRNNFADIPENLNATINRTNDNKIVDIIYVDTQDQITDTTFYFYENSGDTTFVNTVTRQPGYYDYNLNYKFTNTNKLISYKKFYNPDVPRHAGDETNFFYNAKNQLVKIRFDDDFSDSYNEINLYYTSGINDDKEDSLCRLLTGKDYYLPDISWFYPFSFYLDHAVFPNSFSSTNPNHISRITAKHPGLGSEDEEEATLTYELNKNKTLSKVTFHIAGNGQQPGRTIIRKFNY